MRLKVFASSSSGNCLLISSDRTNLLIDAGISMRRTERSLASAGLTLSDIDGVLVTHEHSDHICGLAMIEKKYDVPLYAPHTVANRLIGALPIVEKCMNIIPVGNKFTIGDISVTAFHTPHDTDESVGYRLECGSVFALATDMGMVTDEIRSGLAGADTVLVEANHDREMLISGPYPFQLKRRVLSERGHLSNSDCAVLVKELSESGTKHFILGHLSQTNNSPYIALADVKGNVEDMDVTVECAPVFGCLSAEV